MVERWPPTDLHGNRAQPLRHQLRPSPRNQPPHRTLIVPPSRTNLKRHDVNLNNKGCGRPRDLLNELFQKTKKKKKKTPTPYRSIERDEKYVNDSRREKIWMRTFFFANLNHTVCRISRILIMWNEKNRWYKNRFVYLAIARFQVFVHF